MIVMIFSTSADLVEIVASMAGVLDQKFSMLDKKPSMATTEVYIIPGNDATMIDALRSRLRAIECEQDFIDAFEGNISTGNEFFISELSDDDGHAYVIVARVDWEPGKDRVDLGFIAANFIDLLGEIGITRKCIGISDLHHVLVDVIGKTSIDLRR
jgi:hypothetical protein